MGLVYTHWKIVVVLVVVTVLACPPLRLRARELAHRLFVTAVAYVSGRDDTPAQGPSLGEALIASITWLEGVSGVVLSWEWYLPHETYELYQDPDRGRRVLENAVAAVNAEGKRQAIRRRGRWTLVTVDVLEVVFLLSSGGGERLVPAGSAREPRRTTPDEGRPARASYDVPRTEEPRVAVPRTQEPRGRDGERVRTGPMSLMAYASIGATDGASLCVYRNEENVIGRDPAAALPLPVDLTVVSTRHGVVRGGVRGRALYTDTSTNGTWVIERDGTSRKVDGTEVLRTGTVLALGSPTSEIRLEFR